MAPRKLIIAMLILLGFSTGLAVFAPDPPQPERQVVEAETEPKKKAPDRTRKDPGEEGAGSDRPGGREAVVREVTLRQGRAPRRLEARPGDRLILSVEADRTSEVEVTGLGLSGIATRYAPASFDVLLPEGPGRYEVRREPDRLLLTISVPG